MNKIDFVITWVDGNDPEWIKQKNEYSPDKTADAGEYRYRDMGLLRYWFRTVEKYAPWVNKVHFVTWGHLPEWLNTDCEKLHIVNHKDFIPEKYLPVFNCNPLEVNLHKIEGLEEKFVYFNDDMFLNKAITQEFFFKDGLPCDFAHLCNIYYEDNRDTYAHLLTNAVKILSKTHSYIKSFLENPAKYVNHVYSLKNNIINILKLENKHEFTGFIEHHLATAYLKETFFEAWSEYAEIFEYVTTNKFRTPYDIGQQIFRYHQFATGNFSPVSQESRGKNFNIFLEEEELLKAINEEKYTMLCLNDSAIVDNFDEIKERLIKAYEQKLSRKSMFEI